MSVWRTATASPGLELDAVDLGLSIVEAKVEDKKREQVKRKREEADEAYKAWRKKTRQIQVQWWKDWKAKKEKERQQRVSIEVDEEVVEEPTEVVAAADPDWLDGFLGLQEEDPLMGL